MIVTSSKLIELQHLLDDAVASGLECGCQLAIYEHGELVADLVAGTIAPGGCPVASDTLFPVFSCGKGVATTAVHRLIEKGILTYSTRVADVWPEFGCHGKENILLWHVMAHRTGLHQTPDVASADEIADWKVMCGKIADMTPVWTPGTKCGYQGITFAWLLGETASRADGRSFQDILMDEVIRPLELETEMFFGTTEQADGRIAAIDESRAKIGQLGAWVSTPSVRHSCIPSFAGMMSARALAKHYAALDGLSDGLRLLRPETVENAAIMRRAADDLPGNTWARFGLGYVTVAGEGIPSGIIGHGGALGSEGMLDRRKHLALAFTKNRVDPRHPDHPLRNAISSVLGLTVRRW